MISTLILIFGYLLLPALTQEVPESPCPEVFQYQQKSTGDVYGRITIPYDGSGTLHLGVNASMKGYYTDNRRVKLKIKMNSAGMDLAQKKTESLSYDLYFPFQNAIPKITKIIYNNQRYCTGPPEELVPGGAGVTSLWAGHNYFFQTLEPSQNSIEPQTNGAEAGQRKSKEYLPPN